MSASSTCTYRKSAGLQPLAAAIATTLPQARSVSSSKVPGANAPLLSTAGIPLMNRMPFPSLARLNGKPAGRPGPELTRLIVMGSPLVDSGQVAPSRRAGPCPGSKHCRAHPPPALVAPGGPSGALAPPDGLSGEPRTASAASGQP